MLFDAHNHAFRVLGGVPRRGIYDNMRTAVDKVGRGKERQVNARFSAMASHYLFEAEFCNPASGWEKGQIEKNVQDARHRLWQPMPPFATPRRPERLAGAALPGAFGADPHGSQPGIDRRCMGPRSREPDAAWPAVRWVRRVYAKRVSPTCLIHLERNRYSVPASFANRPVSLRVYPDQHRRRRRRTCHLRARARLRPLPHQPGPDHLRLAALSGGHPAQAWRPAQRRAVRRTAAGLQATAAAHAKPPGGDREMVEILALVLQHDEQAVLPPSNWRWRLASPTKTHILNLLHRLVDGKPTAPRSSTPRRPWPWTTSPRPTSSATTPCARPEARHAS